MPARRRLQQRRLGVPGDLVAAQLRELSKDLLKDWKHAAYLDYRREMKAKEAKKLPRWK